MYFLLELLTLIVFAALNLYLGFSTAIYLRRNGSQGTFGDYLSFLRNREALSWDLFQPAEDVVAAATASTPLQRAAAELAAAPAEAPSPADPSPAPNASEPDEEQDVPPAEESPRDAVDDEPPAAGLPIDELPATGASPSPSEHDELEALLQLSAETQWEDSTANKPAAIVVFESTREQLQQFTLQLDKLDHRLREVLASPSGETLEACGVSLSGAVDGQLNQLRETFTPLMRDASPPEGPSPARNSLELLVSRAGDRLDALLANLAEFSFDAENPAASTVPLLEAHAKSIATVHALRDDLMVQLVTVVRDEVGLSQLATHLRSDQHTGLASRSGFETWIADLQKGRGEERRASLLLIDIDALTAVNEQYGASAGDGVVSAVAQFVAKAREREQLAARIAGQQFALVCGITEARQLAETAERIRQSIEKTTFHYRGHPIHITVSAAAAPIQADDSVDALLERALATVREAKSYGRNRTFLCEDECPTPVVPPEMVIDPQEVTL